MADVRTVETAHATIRFIGGVNEESDDSLSSAEDDVNHSPKQHTFGENLNGAGDLTVHNDGGVRTSQARHEAWNSHGQINGVKSELFSDDQVCNRTRPDETSATKCDTQTLTSKSNDSQILSDDSVKVESVGLPATTLNEPDKPSSHSSKDRTTESYSLSQTSDSLTDSVQSGKHSDDNKPELKVKTDSKALTQKTGTNVNQCDSSLRVRHPRFNPFDTADLEVQDPFPQLYITRAGHLQQNTGHGHSNADLGFSDDHYSIPEEQLALTSVEEIQQAIVQCKQQILQSIPQSERMKNLVAKLVKLRLSLADADAGPAEEDPLVKVIVGHQFKARSTRSAKHYCEKCNSVIWGVVQERYKCSGCGFNVHEKCMNLITRRCAALKVKEDPSFIYNICPEKGLAAQKYKCADCKSNISYKAGDIEPRQCDYNGLYYCDICHWSDTMCLPGRILHNWDFEPVKVCRATKQFLKLMFRKAVIRIQDVNPMLFNFVDELSQIKKLREEILIMKTYFMSCKHALESKLLLQLSERQHFVENSDMYSVKDLMDVADDVLLPKLAKIHTSFAQHIKTDCQVCQGKGFICELCDDTEVLFPFDNTAIVCSQCSTVLHRHCFLRKNQVCPKCQRLTQRVTTPDE